ncbi:MAG: polysaccharide deacetylase family protein [Opitutales bacterium]
MGPYGRIQRHLLLAAQRNFPGALYCVPEIDEPAVALTVDDGPSSRTGEMLDLLGEHGARATFFVHTALLESPGDAVAQLERAAAEGHEIANHMPDPVPSTKLDEATFALEFNRADDTLRTLGFEPRFFRPANGFYQRKKMLPPLLARDYFPRFVLASFLPWDTHIPLPHAYAANLASGVFPGAVLVLHDGEAEGTGRLGRTITGLRQLLWLLEQRGYAVCSLGELLARSPLANERAEDFFTLLSS